MASPSVTYSFSNSTTADASQVNQNFTDLINGMSDGSKDFSISALTCAGNATFNGSTTTIGNASSDDLVITASLASSIPIKTTNTYDIGSADIGLRYLYFASSAGGTSTARVSPPNIAADITLTLPARTGTFALNAPMTIQRFTSGSDQTYTTATNCTWIRVRMIGGGGGGAGSGTAAGTTAGNGGNTLWKDSTGATTYGTAGGGTAGTWGGDGGAGGSASTSGVTQASILEGGSGGAAQITTTANVTQSGGIGGSGAFGGAGRTARAGAGAAGRDNTGGGGGGASNDGVASSYSGAGGGSGGYTEIVIASPAATYKYWVGAAGTAGGAGTSGNAGGAGGSGVIIVEEYYT